MFALFVGARPDAGRVGTVIVVVCAFVVGVCCQYAPLGSGTNGTVYSIVVCSSCGTNGGVFVGGFFGSAGGVPGTGNIAFFNRSSSQWQSVGEGKAGHGSLLFVGLGD